MINNQELFHSLRKKYTHFHYLNFDFEVKENSVFMQYFFQTNELFFAPKMTLNLGKYAQKLNKIDIKGLIFNIGLIELVSYWKATCSPQIVIHNYNLDEKQQNWWKKLYYKGLGEFFYQNGIECIVDDFVQFSFSEKAKTYFDLHF